MGYARISNHTVIYDVVATVIEQGSEFPAPSSNYR